MLLLELARGRKFRAIFPFRCKLLHCQFQFIRVYRQQRAKTGTGPSTRRKRSQKFALMGTFSSNYSLEPISSNFIDCSKLFEQFCCSKLLAQKFSSRFFLLDHTLDTSHCTNDLDPQYPPNVQFNSNVFRGVAAVWCYWC